jgi:beta-glucosidase
VKSPLQSRAGCSAAAALALLGAACLHGGRGAGLDPGRFGTAADDPARRAAALVAALTVDEKVAQLQNAAPAIPRLGVPAYDWWSESLHGVARNGKATVFPQAIGLAATFDEELLRRVGRAIAEEARAKFAAAGGAVEGSGQYEGLTFFAPNVNIYRDPRWGRGQETFGEDPFLTARLGVAYVQGMQGDDPRRLRTAAVGKHFAVHSGPELDRHRFDVSVDAHDLADTYLPQFEALVREAHVAGIMAAYNRVNGQPCVASDRLLGDTLRGRWRFDGFVVGDCGAVGDLFGGHAVVRNGTQAAALALRAGTDLDCGRTYNNLTGALAAGLVTEHELDRALMRLFSVRFRLGLFDPPPAPGQAPPPGTGAFVPPDAHRALAREAARKSLVLLQNDGTLPIATAVRRIAVVGPTADDREVLLGNYHGDPVAPVTILAGVRAAAAARGIAVEAAPGVTLAGRSLARLPAAIIAARAADLVIAVMGLSPRLEGEEGDPDGANPSGDRRDLNLPGAQSALLAAMLETGKPVVVVLTGGGAIALPASGPRRPRAELMAWYPGEQGGAAVADILFGDVAPSGRLPVTFYRSVADLPAFGDYRMAGRTHRYFRGTPRYPFGHGLGYEPITVAGLAVDVPADGGTRAAPGGAAVPLHVVVENPGARAVDDVLPVYASARTRGPRDPVRSLVAFQRVSLAAGERRTVDFLLPPSAFTRIDEAGQRRPVAGDWDLTVAAATVPVRRP